MAAGTLKDARQGPPCTGNSHCARSFPSEEQDKHLRQHGPHKVNICTQLKATCDLQSPHSSMALQDLAKLIQRRKRGHATTTCITCSMRDGCVKSSCSSTICAVMEGFWDPCRHADQALAELAYVYVVCVYSVGMCGKLHAAPGPTLSGASRILAA